MEMMIRASCICCLDFSRVRLKSEIEAMVDSDEEDEEEFQQMAMQDDETQLLKVGEH